MPRLHPSTDRRAKRVPRAFTLVEMLVVMGIIVLLIAALLPAVRGLNNASSRRGAVGTLLGTLDHARMMAINDGTATYVVFASASGDGQKLKPELWGHAYAIYQDHDNITFTPEQRTPWMQLPVGVSFKLADDGGTHTSVTNYTPQQGVDPAFPVAAGALPAGSSSTSLLLPYWKFDSTGAVNIESRSEYLRVLMFPGVINAAGTEMPTQNNGGSAANALLEEIDINPATGRAKYIIDPFSNLATPTPTP